MPNFIVPALILTDFQLFARGRDTESKLVSA